MVGMVSGVHDFRLKKVLSLERSQVTQEYHFFYLPLLHFSHDKRSNNEKETDNLCEYHIDMRCESDTNASAELK